MKSQQEIQRAHDILVSQITGDTPLVFEEQFLPKVRAAVDALCWVLDHDHNDHLKVVLEEVDAALKERGYVLTQLPFPVSDTPRYG